MNKNLAFIQWTRHRTDWLLQLYLVYPSKEVWASNMLYEFEQERSEIKKYLQSSKK